jgi:hypothetical protein
MLLIVVGILSSLCLCCFIGGIFGFIILKCKLPGCPILVSRLYQVREEADAARRTLRRLPRSKWVWCPRFQKKKNAPLPSNVEVG